MRPSRLPNWRHITPVLKGSYRMQGPVDETDHDIEKNTVSSRPEKKFGKCSLSKKVPMRGESGTCNVCSAPCSSCMHLNQALMGSKTEEFSDESCRGNVASQYSFNESGPLSSLKCRASDSLQHTTSETSNVVSFNSGHDSFSENADSKSTLRSSVISYASEDLEILPKLTSGERISEDQLSFKPECVLDQRTFSNKYKEIKAVEGHDDNIACVSRPKDASVEFSNHKRNINSSAASVTTLDPEGSWKGTQFNKLASSEIPSSKDADASSTSPKDKVLECSTELINSTKEAASDIVSVQKCFAHKGNLIGGNSEASMKTYPKSEAQTEKDHGNPPGETLKSLGEDERNDSSKELVELPVMHEPPLRSVSVDESDESDIVEQDVKVCDICGDAGREDLLAICSRCSDGAEHTYCMRKMLRKVPEGDWLCEECKSAEEDSENQKQGSEIEGKRTEKVSSSTHVSGKRCAENMEVASAKRQELETGTGSPKPSSPSRIVTGSPKPSSPSRLVTGSPKPSSPSRIVTELPKPSSPSRLVTGSPKPSSPSRIVTELPKPLSPSTVVALSRDSSFKSLDKGKTKSAYQTPFRNQSSNDIPETVRSPMTGPRLQTSKSTLFKSNSFNAFNSKPKVKLVDEVPQKQKGAREHTSIDMKEGPARMISKSMSFKPANSGRTNASESKVKMLSSNFTHVQDLKGLKQAKERGPFERKNSCKLERPLIGSTTASSTVSTAKVDQKLGSRVETSLPSFISNHRDSKVVQSDGKLSLSKVTSSLGRKGVETPVTSAGASSTSGMCGSTAEQKLNQVCSKDEPVATHSLNAVRSSNNAEGIVQDGLHWSQEITNQHEKTRESSSIRSATRPTTASASKGVVCQKCKEIGHVGEFCTVSIPQASGTDISAARSSKEEMHEGNKLKAAIHAALLRRPEFYRKKRVLDQSDDLSISNADLNYEIASHDQMLVSNKLKDAMSTEGSSEGPAILGSSTSESSKQTTVNSLKQFGLHPIDVFSAKVGDSCSNAVSVGKPTIRHFPCQASTVLLKKSVIPAHEFIWQGGFELHRGGKLPEFCGGFQAHLSTYASPKVLEVVNKFSHKISLHEVSRLSTWPSQFYESGANEDNIALYFFAKDNESFERNYKSLLDNMVKNDLALKGNFDGVELLIFPSNQLPEKSQRWNTLFFLWGVFRGKRVNCTDLSKKLQIPSLNVVPLNKDIPPAVMTLSENLCSERCIDEELLACDRSCNMVPTSNAPNQPCATVSGDCENNVTSLEQTRPGYQENLEQQDSRPYRESISKIRTSIVQSSQEMKPSSPSLKEQCLPERLDAQIKTSCHASGKSGSNSGEKILKHRDDSSDTENTPSSRNFPAGNECCVLRVAGNKIQGRMNEVLDQVKVERELKEDAGYVDRETALERDLTNHRKRPYLDLSETSPQTSTGTSQIMPWNEASSMSIYGESGGKRMKTGFSVMLGHSDSRGRHSGNGNFASQVIDPGPCSSIEKKFDEVCDEKVILEDLGTHEKYLFPVDSHRVKDFGLGENSVPREKHTWDDDEVPNLELALGAETKPATKGMLPFFVGAVGKKNNQNMPLDAVTREDDDGVSASLSLSLSFPFPDKEQTVKPVLKAEQLLPERQNLNNSLLFFGGYRNK
ncbi:uncharacterized protein LOC121256342 isoform X2 [Juglans microcarpa x Juglans regia]|uniref:uncharacterized protein LOC121256342 isoform X2 n=1 Tax=Juglans microcarpa x Juglans regia TaxID=2249226 RepID=UPI001B7E3C75|nr:uncharacterized protein LOC121256342 isoform X2 [Juglans microcarpa x Juglans regia]